MTQRLPLVTFIVTQVGRGTAVSLRLATRFGAAVLKFRATGGPAPLVVVWMVTGRCNQSCPHCDNQFLRAWPDLPTSAALDLVDQMAQAGVLVVSLTGGEPLVRDDIGAITRRIRQHGMACKVNTNGFLLEQRLKDLGPLDLLQISLDGPGDTQDLIRGTGSFRAAVRAAEVARKARIPFHFVGVFTKFNVDRLDEVLDCAARLGGRISFQPMAPSELNGPGLEEFAPSRDRLLTALDFLERVKREGGTRGRTLKNTLGEIEHYRLLTRDGLAPVDCEPVMATLMPDGRLTFCKHSCDPLYLDARTLGFAEAFRRLKRPRCDGCRCVGTLRLARLARLDPAVIQEMLTG